MTQVFLIPPDFNVHTWPDPGNWNQIANTVECVGTGGNGASTGNFNGGGGGGGAYAVGRNMTLTFPVSYSVGNANGNATNFNSTSPLFVNSGNVVSATAGGTGNSSSGGGGSPGTGFYPAGFAGGVGGNSPGAPGGGGGAGGPHGAGAVGVAGGASVAGAGGAGDGGTVPGGAAGSPGNSGTQWDSSHGIGSGGGGGAGGTAVAGGNYGGGGGGSNSASQGIGAKGIIVITYAPLYSTQIGVVRYWAPASPNSKTMWMTIIPTYDSELDNPAWITNISTGTNLVFDMVRISQAQYLSYANFAAFQSAILAM